MGEFILKPDYEIRLSDLARIVDGVAEDFTLLDAIRLVFEAERRWPGTAAAFGMERIDAFYAEATGERDADDEDNLRYLELYRAFDHDVETIAKATRWNRRRPKGRRRISDVQEVPDRGGTPDLMSFHGIGEHWTDSNIECADWERCDCHRQYSIWLTPLNNLAHLPIRMNCDLGIYRPSLRELRHPVRRVLQQVKRLRRLAAPLFRRYPVVRYPIRQVLRRLGLATPLLYRWDRRRLETPVMTVEIHPTLHSFLSSVLWELTFSGPHPDDREAQSKKLEKSCEDAKGQAERGELIDMDDMLDEFDGMRGEGDDEV